MLGFTKCLLLFSLIALSCNKESDEIQEQTLLNTAYGSDPKQKMDVYLPAGRNAATTKVIILVHGGGWAQGDKNEITPYIDTLKKRLPGYAIFNINYRLASGTSNLFPTQENDVKSAVEFIYSKRAEYRISDKYVMLGLSAGAHLSLLHAYKYISPVKIKAVVDFFGPSDLTEMYNNPASPFAPPSALASVIGATPTTNATIYTQSSPLSFVNAQSTPTIILHGGADPLVATSQATALKAKLDMSGVMNQYVFYPTESHGWVGATLTDSFDKIVAFLNTTVN